MQPNVGPIRGDLDRRVKAGQLVNTEGGVMSAEQVVNLWDMPAGLAKLECVAVILRNSVQQSRQTFSVDPPLRRQLKQDRSQLSAEGLRPWQKIVQRVLRFLQFLVMRKKAARFDGKFKVFRGSIAPGRQGLGFGQHIEAVVDFDRVETAVIVSQHLRG